MNEPVAIVLAAGKGTRMKSELPKVLCQACERPLIDWVLDALEKSSIARSIVVVGYRADAVRESLQGRRGVTFVEQTEQKGTGHAAMVCREALGDHDGAVVILTGDSPLIQVESVTSLLDEYRESRPACILGTLNRDDPHGLGRIVRNEAGEFVGIVEEKDATDEQRKITEVNMSTYVFDCKELFRSFDLLDNNNKQGEYYLTDCPGILLNQGKDVRALPVLKPCESLSVNTVEDLAVVEAELRRIYS